ncbi:hypothetical protein [Candidatus Vidania fulgoroideorum]
MKKSKLSVLGFGNIGKYLINYAFYNNYYVKSLFLRKFKKENIIMLKSKIFRKLYITNKIFKVKISDFIIEVIGGEKAFFFIKCLIKKKKNIKTIITANKNMVSKYYFEILKLYLKYNVNFLFEASIGGGLPIVKNLYNIKNINFNKTLSILNGTTNYILSYLFKNKPSINNAINKAKIKGFAESDMSFDIEGKDVYFKMNILGILLYNIHTKINDFYIEKFCFFNKKIISLLKKQNKTIKYIGYIKKKRKIVCYIICCFIVSKSSIFYNIDYEYNIINLNSKRFGSLNLSAKGAGKIPTVCSLFSDFNSNVNNISRINNKYIIYSNIITYKIYIFVNRKYLFYLFKILFCLKILNKIKLNYYKGVFVLKSLFFFSLKKTNFLKQFDNNILILKKI